ncbi:MAG: DUF1700 domain-containing protein [Coriobacteriales bacterium]|jgi:uncharacterized membrane protein|nr:DUF1700 domain-containing protein [Coriobacteriales bacterium]
MMDRNTYLQQLEAALASLPANERQDALAFYAEYLDDAGPQGLAAALESLGSPSQLAAQIKAESAIRGLSAPPAIPQPQPQVATVAPQPVKQASPWKTVWIVILAIFAIPVGIPLLIVLAAVIFAVLAVLFAVLIALAATVVGIFAGGILSIVAGFILLFSSFATGLFYMGSGLLVLGLALLFGWLFWKLGGLLIKGVAKLFNLIRGKVSKKNRDASIQGSGAADPGMVYAQVETINDSNAAGINAMANDSIANGEEQK